MKGALVMFGGITVLLLVLVGKQGKWAQLGSSLSEQGKLLVPLIALAVVLAACVEVLIDPDRIASWVGSSSGIRGVFVGWIAGALTPGGGPIGLPLAGALSRRGAALPVVMTYLTSMSLLSVIRAPMEWGILGPRITAIRWALSALIPLGVGVFTMLLQRWVKI